MKFLLIDDHISFCEGLISAINRRRPDFDFSFESDAELLPSAILNNKKFDLIIVDLMMPGLGGVELVKYLNKKSNFTPVAVMSSVEDKETIREMFSLGILGYLPKYYSVEQIIEAIEDCLQGRMHVPEKFSKSLRIGESLSSKKVRNKAQSSKAASDGIKLTNRQTEILGLMDQGLSNQEIAEALFVSLATVKTHIHRLYTSLDVNNRVSCLKAAKLAKIK